MEHNRALDACNELRDRMGDVAEFISLASGYQVMCGKAAAARTGARLCGPALAQTLLQTPARMPARGSGAAAPRATKVILGPWHIGTCWPGTPGFSASAGRARPHHAHAGWMHVTITPRPGPAGEDAAALLAPEARQLAAWHCANLEFASAATLGALSMRSWDQDDPHELMGAHVLLPGAPLPLRWFFFFFYFFFEEKVVLHMRHTQPQKGHKPCGRHHCVAWPGCPVRCQRPEPALALCPAAARARSCLLRLGYRMQAAAAGAARLQIVSPSGRPEGCPYCARPGPATCPSQGTRLVHWKRCRHHGCQTGVRREACAATGGNLRLVAALAEGLPVLYNTVVTDVEYSASGVSLMTATHEIQGPQPTVSSVSELSWCVQVAGACAAVNTVQSGAGTSSIS